MIVSKPVLIMRTYETVGCTMSLSNVTNSAVAMFSGDFSSRELQFFTENSQTNSQLLQHLDLRSLDQVINRKLGALNTYTTYLMYCEQMKMSWMLFFLWDECLPGSRSDDIQVIANWLENPDQVACWVGQINTSSHSWFCGLIIVWPLLHFSFVVPPVIPPQWSNQWQGNWACCIHELSYM